MRTAYPVATVRETEAAAIAAQGEAVLMQRAAAGVAAAAVRMLRHRVYGSRVLVLVGPGNNGGDALYAGAQLARRGARVSALVCLGRPHAAGLAALSAAGGRIAEEVSAADLAPDLAPDLAIDGVLGIGGRPGLPEGVAAVAATLRDREVPVLAVDLPSGVGADTGGVPGAAIRADRTVTFGVHKPCHLLEPARSLCGVVELVDIGLGPVTADREWFAEADEDVLRARWPFPDARSDKYSRGVVGLDTGSGEYAGAAVLSTTGAVHAGAGMVRFLGAEEPAALIRQRLPNVVVGEGRVQAYVLGCGWGERPDGVDVLARIAGTGLPAVVDADGLRCLPDRPPANWLLTPHAGELARLLDRDRHWVSEDPVRAVRAGAAATGATVLLKGATQLVAQPGSRRIGVALAGPAWTAQAGSGDTLAGICGVLLAAGREPYEAGLLGASIQALAARRHPGPFPPQQLARRVAAELARLAATRAGGE